MGEIVAIGVGLFGYQGFHPSIMLGLNKIMHALKQLPYLAVFQALSGCDGVRDTRIERLEAFPRLEAADGYLSKGWREQSKQCRQS